MRRLLPVLCLLAWSCGKGPESPDSGQDPIGMGRAGIERPEIELAPGARPLAAPTEPLILVPPAEVAPWVTNAKGAHVTALDAHQDPAQSQALVLPGTGRRSLTIPGPFEATACIQLRLELTYDERARTRVILYAASEAAEGSEVKLQPIGISQTDLLRPRPTLHTLEFSFPDNARATGQVIERMVLEFDSADTIALTSLEWLATDLARLLPSPETGAAPVAVGPEARLALGLSNKRPLETSFDYAAGQSLRFACAVPRELRRSNVEPRLIAALRAKNDEVLVSVETILDQPGPAGSWIPVSLSLVLPGEVPSTVGPLRLELSVEARAGVQGEVFALVTPPELHQPSGPAPSVLLITSDTHRADALGLFDPSYATENLDALAQRGVVFEHCTSTTNVTMPSHVSLLTGVHVRDTGVLNNQARLSRAAPTLAQAFRDAGYNTLAAVSVRHLDPLESGLGSGFDRMVAPGIEWPAEETLKLVHDWLPEFEGRPLFLWVHLFDAHTPYAPPGAWDRKYYGSGDPFDSSLPATGVSDDWLPVDLAGLRDLQYPVAQYRAEVAYLDHSLGALLDLPRFRQGLVAFTADHGEILDGTGGVWFAHAELYPDNLRVPMLLGLPEGASVTLGPRIRTPVMQHQLGRTLLDLAGLEHVSFPGQSFMKPSEAPADQPRFAVSAYSTSASMTAGPWHLILHLREHRDRLPRTRARHEVELYHIERDPGCAENLVAIERSKARELRAILVAWLQATEPRDWGSPRNTDAAQLAELERLGYVEPKTPATDETEAELWIDPDCDCSSCTMVGSPK